MAAGPIDVTPSAPGADAPTASRELSDRALAWWLCGLGVVFVVTVAYVVQVSLPPWALRLPGQDAARALVHRVARQDWGFFAGSPDARFLRAIVLTDTGPVVVASGVADVSLADGGFGRDHRRLRGELRVVATRAWQAGARWQPCAGDPVVCATRGPSPRVEVTSGTSGPRVCGEVVLEDATADPPSEDGNPAVARTSNVMRLSVRC